MLQDVALLGLSGADQTVIAVLSGCGAPYAVDVAWRRVRRGQDKNKSRGDPIGLPSVYLEPVGKGAINRFCWGRVDVTALPWIQSIPTPADAIGIVEPGVARFDYVLDGEKFVLFAPVP
jgi:hypothetical protein